MRKGPLGVEAINAAVGNALNPGPGAVRITDGEVRTGDPVVMTRNDSDLEVFNGTIGTVRLTTDTGLG